MKWPVVFILGLLFAFGAGTAGGIKVTTLAVMMIAMSAKSSADAMG